MPSYVVGFGPQQFARLGRELAGRRQLTALQLPGTAAGEPLPASLDAAVGALADATLEAAGAEPFVLLGYSSGGALARALAEGLERDGNAPAGLVLLDSFFPESEAIADIFSIVVGRILELDLGGISVDDEHLIAMGAYLRAQFEWQPGALAAPGMMLRASAGLVTALPDETELPEWQKPETTVEIEADHFSLIGDDVGKTATAIDTWMAERFGIESAAEAEG